jgi:hypothetical protein
MCGQAVRTSWRIGEPLGIALAVVGLLVAVAALVYFSQFVIERNALSPATDPSSLRELREVDKLSAEIRQIRSDTGGSLFWLKLLAVLVTVGGAVGGYLIGQSHTTRKRLEFENRKKVDELYQQMVIELSNDKDLLRTAAAVKLGELLRSFPQEWEVTASRRDELIQLTKQVLAASLAIEGNPKVLKTLTIQVVLHRSWAQDAEATRKCHPWNGSSSPALKGNYGDLRGADLSNAKGNDAYWARVDFTYADFYKAALGNTSFREAILVGAQFRETDLAGAVLSGADCEEANFKLADVTGADLTRSNLSRATFEAVDLRGADLGEARLAGTRFLRAKVHGVSLTGAVAEDVEGEVDISPAGDGSTLVPAGSWARSAAG